MTHSLLKNTFREIRNTKARFISIMAIIALGVGFFAGIKATSPSMYSLAETYYSENKLMDYRVISAVGFTEDDISEIEKLDGVESVMPSYYYDASLSADEGGQLIHLISVPKKYKKNDELNTLVTLEGKLPEKTDEIAVEGVGFNGSSHQTGDTIKFAELAGDAKVSDSLKSLSYKVVGKVQSPLYISYQRGKTKIGDGKLDEYMYINSSSFKIEKYNEVYIKADFSDKYSPFSDEYDDKSDELKKEIEKVAESRTKVFKTETLKKARDELEKGKKEYAKQKSDTEKKLAKAKKEIDESEAALSAQAALAETAYAAQADYGNANQLLAQLEAGKAEYEKNKKEADKKLAEAEKKLKDEEKELKKTEKKLNSMSKSVWYVRNRDDNPGYDTFTQNADRLDAVASVFPLFFLLVAILVCVTTMTRLIEEKRTEIATFKALGYGNASIIAKFVIYSLIAGVTGSVIGTAIGVATLPFIIYNAYKIMYYIGDITLVLNVPIILMGILAAILCTTAVSIIVCAKSLRLKPAQAMRPKAPKPGKRILLERITPLWKHMSFTAKLTARNLFRYKARLCMTVIGVAGCTALIVAAFGLLNSFDPLTEVQFGEVFHYDAVVVPKDGGSEKQLDYLVKKAEKDEDVKRAMLCMQEEITIDAHGKHYSAPLTINVFSDTAHFDEIVHLQERESKNPLTLDDSGVMINEKYAATNKLKVGDTVKIKGKIGTAEAKIAGIYEQYINNYLYMTPKLYHELFKKQPVYNMLCVSLDEAKGDRADNFSSQMLSDNRIVAVTFMAEKITEFKNMLNSLNMVVLVMIVCAAALAFVVLYNLTNINIAERVREIATFKVLGFYNRETSSFIYKENIILTLMGIAVGLGLGILLTGFIVRTVEIDNVMFGREIYFTSYLYAAGLTMLFSLLVNGVMSFKIKAVNMVESLKSVE